MRENELQDKIQRIRDTVANQIDLSRNVDDDIIRETIEEVIESMSKDSYMSLSDKRLLLDGTFNAMRGLDVLQPLVDDPTITEIMINGHDNIFIEKNGVVQKLDVAFESEKKLENVIISIVEKVNRTVNESVPIVDARLADGSRVNAVIPPIALDGPTLTIRKFPEKPYTMNDLIEKGSVTEEVAEVLRRMVIAKYNIFISGGTGSGKTTFLNALSNYIPKNARIITIEDSAELQIKGVPNIIRMESRNANAEGKGEITIRDLIKTSLRMRPDRIIVGEVRGPEALDMLQAMNTGHEGSLSTGHANSAKDMLSRLETMVILGSEIPLSAVRQQIGASIDIIIQLSRMRDNTRKTVEITEVKGYNPLTNTIELNPLYVFKETGETDDGKVLGSLVRTENALINKDKLRQAGLSDNI